MQVEIYSPRYKRGLHPRESTCIPALRSAPHTVPSRIALLNQGGGGGERGGCSCNVTWFGKDPQNIKFTTPQQTTGEKQTKARERWTCPPPSAWAYGCRLAHCRERCRGGDSLHRSITHSHKTCLGMTRKTHTHTTPTKPLCRLHPWQLKKWFGTRDLQISKHGMQLRSVPALNPSSEPS